MKYLFDTGGFFKRFVTNKAQLRRIASLKSLRDFLLECMRFTVQRFQHRSHFRPCQLNNIGGRLFQIRADIDFRNCNGMRGIEQKRIAEFTALKRFDDDMAYLLADPQLSLRRADRCLMAQVRQLSAKSYYDGLRLSRLAREEKPTS